MIEARSLQLTFAKGTPLENPALRGLSLSIPDGQFVTVIGSNGAGKSTLLNALSGETRVDHGHILIDGHDVTGLPSHRRAQWVARVFQDPKGGTCEALSIAENLALAERRGQRRRLQRATRKDLLAQFQTALAPLGLGLENRLHDQIGLLSGGQRQAVSLLMATLTPSRLLLLDEHTAALDPKTADTILRLTEHIVREQKLTTLMVTHSMKQALSHGDRTIMLHQGKIVFDIAGAERAGMSVPDLLTLFEQQRGEALADDRLLLG